jgi:thiamine transporter
MRSQRIRFITLVALTAVLGWALGFVKIWEMPQGGSISLEMLPIIVLGVVEGPWVAIAAGALTGMLGLIINPVVVHPVQVLLDYPLAYAMVGLSGVFSRTWWSLVKRGKWHLGIWLAILPATLLGALARYPFHVLSGYIFFGQYAPPGQPVLIYSLIYNSFVFVAAVPVFAAAVAVVPALARTSMFSSRAAVQPS